MPKLVLDVSKKMLTEFSWNPAAATVEMDAGWLLLASLVSSMPKEELADQLFDILLLWADPFVGGSHSRTRNAQDFTSELWVLSAAIEALVAFIRSFVSPTAATGTNGIFLQPVLAYLRGALSHLSTFVVMHLPNLRPALDLFTIRILMAYQSVSDPKAYKSEHSQILETCMTPFCNPSFCEESSCLKFLLDKRDACLGPWIPGRDSFEDELRSFDGGKDGLMPCVWEEELISFPQPFSLSKVLVNQMLLCLGAIFSCQDDSGKALVLTKIDYCLKAGKKQFFHLSSITNASVALLASLKAMLDVRVESCGPEILCTLQSILMGILAESEITSAQRRACAEGLGLLARLGTDSFTARMAKNLLGELVSATDSYYIGSVALSLGCIHRSVGGMALSSLVPVTVTSLSSLAKSSNATLQLWSLHALLLTIEASGLSFVSQVQATLFLVMEILLCEENGLVELRQVMGRIVNAIVAVLGPELAPRSTFFSRCKSVITEISSCQEISALFESVRFTQQLVLFAPHAVSIHAHVQSLLPTLSSRQPSLRYLAVSTLRHLIDKYPTMAEEKIEEELFRMLDEETDSEIGNLVRSTITRLLYASCPTCPSRWLSLLRKMVLSASTMNIAEYTTSIENEEIIGSSEGGSKLYFGQDDEGMIGSSSGGSIQDFNSVNKGNKHLRYRTRLFAAECLGHLPEAVGANPTHFDLLLASNLHGNGSSSTDWLVFHLQEILSLSYQISTGQFMGMQSIGVELLSTILEKFGKTQDPDLPGHLLLEQYQAQLVSAVRSAIGTYSSPFLLEAGLLLATKVLTSSILSGDRVAVSRMFSLISRPLDEIKDLCYPSFAEWVACKIKVRLLAAHASIKRFLYQFLRKEDNIPDEYLQLASLLSNRSIILGQYWISILKDYVFISFGLNSKPNFKPFLDGIRSPLVSSKVRACLAEAWPLILEATSLDSFPLRLEVDQASKVSSLAAFQKSTFISGHGMVRLEPSDYSFLWGLSWLTLFQGQQPLSAKQPRTILCNLKIKYDCDSVVETHGLTSTEIALLVFQSLSQEKFFHLDFLTLDLCKELLQFLIYADPSADSWNRLVVGLLSQIVQFCPNAYFEVEDFRAVVLELFFKCLSALHSSNMFSEDETNFTGLFSQLFITAEGLVKKMNHKKNQQKMVTALISITSKRFRGASTKLCLSKVLVCLHDLMQFLKSNLKDEAGCVIDDRTHVKTVLLNWSRMLALLCQDCSNRIHTLDNKMNDLSKLLGKILSLCLEEAAALAKFTYQTQIFKDNIEESYQLMLFSILRVCIKCIQDALCDSDRQVQTAGLNLLKLVAQRELAEPSNIKGHHFFLFLGGELLGDIYSLIQHELKESLTKESISLVEECLGLLFLFHTLEQKKEQTTAILKLLLETLVMVFTISNETRSQGLQDVNAIARRLMGHLIHSPASASQLKDVMLTMPVFRRQQLQDVIRASVTQDQMMASKVNQQSEIQGRADHRPPESGGAVAAQTPEYEEHGAGSENDEVEDSEDDWDAFQSLPAEAPTPTATVSYPSGVENDVEKFAGDSEQTELPTGGNPADTERTRSDEIRIPDTKKSVNLIYSAHHEGSGTVIDPAGDRCSPETYRDFQSDESSEIETKMGFGNDEEDSMRMRNQIE
ncbi:hypothetical protein KSP40_PGU016098 [Platanthera guangdongensis]|uniref:HEAT repeat-containing protein 5B n=1 Tax=Platanthera guangdongensis TaxID=2320717 RepID=A0ABR2LH04_9ASPA